jgi:hypothetical protein
MNSTTGVWKGIFIVLAVIGGIAVVGFLFMLIMHGTMMSKGAHDSKSLQTCFTLVSPAQAVSPGTGITPPIPA